jgi:transcriptional regulator with XRE-family HTH domain
MKTIHQIIKKLPVDRRAKIGARAQTLIAEEVALQHLRKARRLTQRRMAELLGIGQDSVSRIENRSDLLLSTLKSYVEAMGGSLKLVVEFPDGSVVLSTLSETETEGRPTSTEKSPRGTRRLSVARASERGN